MSRLVRKLRVKTDVRFVFVFTRANGPPRIPLKRPQKDPKRHYRTHSPPVTQVNGVAVVVVAVVAVVVVAVVGVAVVVGGGKEF